MSSAKGRGAWEETVENEKNLTLGDAFNRRKKLAADLAAWIGRLQSAGAVRRSFRTSALEGDNAFVPFAGSEKSSMRASSTV